MKKRKTVLLLLVMILVAASTAWCDLIADLMKIDSDLAKIDQSDLATSVNLENKLKAQENKLFDKLIESKDQIKSFIEHGDRFESGMSERFINRLKFEVNQENRTDLKAYLDDWHNTWGGDGATVRGKKKIAYIYGNEVNLYDGEWHNTADGKRFWVSNEYPDIILTPAEYRRYAQNAVIVED
ncbi:MAG: hypothetical protein Kow0029_09620 [Candidatus Rifleibacteriota bacterium]